ncbi:hypothetical protein HMI56_003652 [Coelomomyces lativittatus]|nr:hypothetical protein HMI56_003652 [Coelomomyces lativittatus]
MYVCGPHTDSSLSFNHLKKKSPTSSSLPRSSPSVSLHKHDLTPTSRVNQEHPTSR